MGLVIYITGNILGSAFTPTWWSSFPPWPQPLGT